MTIHDIKPAQTARDYALRAGSNPHLVVRLVAREQREGKTGWGAAYGAHPNNPHPEPPRTPEAA